ncbi:MAG: hypothetical protein JO057_27725, partial [Chloroflexi bacterium]|nr:hypothetical protein [Chloroflexota bacterium]
MRTHIGKPLVLRLTAACLSVLVAVGPQVQPAAAQSIPSQPVTVQGTPTPNYTVRPSATPPPSGVQVVTCGGQGRIFQYCPIDGPAEIRLENQAIDGVLALHQLPASDRDRVLGWARSDVRAYLFANLLAAYRKPASDRTPDEATAIAGLTKAVRQKRIDAANIAIDDYNQWNQNPCRFTPPNGFTYNRGTACGNGVFPTFGRPNPPTSADFAAYGVAAAYGAYQSDASLQAISGDTAAALGMMAGLGAVPIAGSIGAAIGANLTVATFIAIQPFLIQTAGAIAGSKAAALAAPAGTVGAISV